MILPSWKKKVTLEKLVYAVNVTILFSYLSPNHILFSGCVSEMLISFSPGLQEKGIVSQRKCPLSTAASRED